MFHGLRAAALTAAIFFGGSFAAAAAPLVPISPVFKSGQTFHVMACPPGGLQGARCFAHLVTDSAGRGLRLPDTARPMRGGGGIAVYYSMAQLRAAYGITGGGSHSTVVAIVDAYGYPNAAADVATYRGNATWGGAPPLMSCASFATATGPCLKIVNETGGSVLPKSNAGWDEEQALDLDMVSAMCPNCSILLVQANSASFLDLATAVQTAANMGAHAIGNSYGGGENGSNAYEPYYNHPGVAVTASAGDNGYGVSFPASSPHVIAVGGTNLQWNGATRSETAWTGTGSGCSSVYAEPSWQVPSPTQTNVANNTLCTKRMLNDVSADADPNSGVVVFMNIPPYAPGFYVFGGTSASAQIISGIYGEKPDAVNYGDNPYATPGSTNDVRSGSDGRCGGTYFCTAVSGYDGPTGLGTPHGDAGF